MEFAAERQAMRMKRLQRIMMSTVGNTTGADLGQLVERMGDIAEAELSIIYILGPDKVLRRKAAHHFPRNLSKNLSPDGIDVEGLAPVVNQGSGLVGQAAATWEIQSLNLDLQTWGYNPGAVGRQRRLSHAPEIESPSSRRSSRPGGDSRPPTPGAAEDGGRKAAFRRMYDSGIFEIGMDVPIGFEAETILAVPLIGGNAMRLSEQTVEGVALFLNKREGGGSCFDQDDQDVMLVAGKLVASNITASTSLAAQQHSSQRVKSLLQMVTMVAQPEYVVDDDMITGILNFTREAMNAEVATLYAVSKPGILEMCLCSDRSNSGDISILPGEALFGQGLVGLCAISKEIVACILDDDGKDSEARFDISIDSPLGFHPSTVACNALLGKGLAGDEGPCIGVLVCYDKKGAFGSVGTFSEEDLELLKSITPVMSSIVQGAQQQLGKARKGLGSCDLAAKFTQLGDPAKAK